MGNTIPATASPLAANGCLIRSKHVDVAPGLGPATETTCVSAHELFARLARGLAT
jgi:hypothetical protein